MKDYKLTAGIRRIVTITTEKIIIPKVVRIAIGHITEKVKYANTIFALLNEFDKLNKLICSAFSI